MYEKRIKERGGGAWKRTAGLWLCHLPRPALARRPRSDPWLGWGVPGVDTPRLGGLKAP